MACSRGDASAARLRRSRRGAGDPAGALAEAEASKGEHRAARFAALAMGTAHRFERVDVEAAESGEEIV